MSSDSTNDENSLHSAAAMLAVLREAQRTRHQIRVMLDCGGDHEEFSNGEVVSFSRQVIILRQRSAFSENGVQIINRVRVKQTRRSRYEETTDRILRFRGGLKRTRLPRWLSSISTMREAITAVHERDIWPGVLMPDTDEPDGILYLGPIVHVGRRSFKLLGYDADGTWEKTYSLDYGEVGTIDLFDEYGTIFSEYMRKTNPPPKELLEGR